MRLNSRYAFLFKNTLLFTVANFANKLIVFFLLPFYTAFLTTEEYAVIEMISTAQQLVFPIVTLDITEAVIRFCMEKNSDKKAIFTPAALVVIAGNIVLAIISAATAAESVGNGKFVLYFFLFCMLVSVNTLLSSFYRTIDRLGVITVASIINTLIVTVMNIFLIAVRGMGIDGYYISYITGNTVAIVLMLCVVDIRPYLGKIPLVNMKRQLWMMLEYSLPLIPNALFWWVNSGLDRVFLTAISGLSVVGMYAAANKIPAVLSTLATIFQQAWGLSAYRENESASKRDFFREVYGAYNLFLLLITVGLILLSEFACSLLLSKSFFDAWVWVPWLLLGFYTNSLCSFVGTEFTAAKKTGWILVTTALAALVNICFNLMLIPKLSGMGAAIATSISYFVLLETRIWILEKRFGIRINNLRILFLHGIITVLILSVTQCFGGIRIVLSSICLLLLLAEEKTEICFLYRKIIGIRDTK